jgi:RNA polymerase sigma-70 factor (ECF subfamily)
VPGHGRRHRLQAEIAAVHAGASSYAETDFERLLALSQRLCEVWPNPVVLLNHAATVALARGPEAGLAALDRCASDPRLVRYRQLPAARAELLRRCGRLAEAAAAYEAALAIPGNDAESEFLARRLRDVRRA